MSTLAADNLHPDRRGPFWRPVPPSHHPHVHRAPAGINVDTADILVAARILGEFLTT